MIETATKYAYKAFGLTILSEIPLKELQKTEIVNTSPDLVVKKADLTSLWATQKDEKDDYFVTKKEYILFNMPDIAIFMIRNGNEILVSKTENALEDQLRLYILGTCMGTTLIQRGILPLHGSAIAIDGKVYAIVGESGAGKSTLASAFLKKGYKLLSDDVIPVTFNADNEPIVIPAYPQQKLWIESLHQFGMNSDNYQPIAERETKFAIPVQSSFFEERLPLAGVFELVKMENEEIEIEPIQNLERFYPIYNHTYRNFLFVGLGLMDWHFSTTTKILSKIDLFQIRRPVTRFTANELPDLILEKLKRGEKCT